MRRSLKQTCLAVFAVLQIIAIIVCLSAPLRAEAPNPTPTPTPAPTTPPTASFSQALANLASRASDLLPILRNEIEGPLLPWLEGLSMFLAVLVAIGTFARMLRENAGAGADVYWWFVRAGIILALIGSGPKILDGMFIVGREIAVGEDGSSPLFQLYVKQRGNFDTAYRVFQEGLFTVKGVPVETAPGGVLGVLFSTESSAEDPVRKLDTISMSMPLVFDSLNFSRGVLTFGDFFLTMLGGFLMIAMRVASPVMIALAIDRSLAQRATYPYVWGAVVLTLIWPTVVILIKAIAYMGGNVAMALGDKQLFYQFDDRTMGVIHSGSQHPFYTAVFAAVIMLIAGLSVWAAPYLAYQMSQGRVYEGLSTTISSWVGQGIGAGVEYYSTATAARLTRQAEVLQAEGGYSAEITRAGAAKESADLQARAGKIIGVTGAQAGLATQLAGIEGSRREKVMGLAAENQFNQTSLHAQQGLSVADQKALMERGIRETEVDRAARTQEWFGGKVIRASDWGGNVVRSVTDGFGNKGVRIGGAVVGEGVKLAGGAYGLYQQYMSIQNRAAGNSEAIRVYSDNMIRNQGDYVRVMEGANNTRANDLMGAAKVGADVSAAGARQGYGIAAGGYNTAYNLNLQGNRINYEGTVRAAGQARDAAVVAARLRENASIISSVGHNLARGMEQGLTPRY